jgi:predicted secreted protein
MTAPTLPWPQRRLAAMQSAEETLRDLRLPVTERIDVYAAVEGLGLWLVFQPLGGLLGAIVPHGTGGVIVTSQRGPGLQRFTAAHEIGHWRMDGEALALDNEENVQRPRDDDRERAAQVFAAYFLMPPPLVYATLSGFGLEGRNDLTAGDVYRVARDMGSSFEATARHLHSLGVLTASRRDDLLRLGRAGGKAELTLGRRPAGDVWDVTPDTAGSIIELAPGDEVIVVVPETPSTGFTWSLEDHSIGTAENADARPVLEPPLVGDCPPLSDPAPTSSPAGSHATSTLAGLASAAAAADPEPASGAFHVVANAYLPRWATPEQARRPATTRRRRADRRDTAMLDDTSVTSLTTHSSPSAIPAVSGVGARMVSLRADRSGAWRLIFDYHRPFDPDSSQGQLEIRARVRPELPLPYDVTELAANPYTSTDARDTGTDLAPRPPTGTS